MTPVVWIASVIVTRNAVRVESLIIGIYSSRELAVEAQERWKRDFPEEFSKPVFAEHLVSIKMDEDQWMRFPTDGPPRKEWAK